MPSARPLKPDDLPAAVRIVAAARNDLNHRIGHPPASQSSTSTTLDIELLKHFQASDPHGAWVCEDHNGAVIGVAISTIRGRIWGLPLLFVHPSAQGAGIGRLLLQHASEYGASCGQRLIVSSEDPRAFRRYLRLGLTSLPAVRAHGRPRSRISHSRMQAPIFEADADDLDQVDATDTAVRGGTRRADINFLLRTGGRLWLYSAQAGRGYALLRTGEALGDGCPLVVAETSDIAAALLDHVLASSDAAFDLYGLTGRHHWAVETCAAHGLSISPGPTVFASQPDQIQPNALWSGVFV